MGAPVNISESPSIAIAHIAPHTIPQSIGDCFVSLQVINPPKKDDGKSAASANGAISEVGSGHA